MRNLVGKLLIDPFDLLVPLLVGFKSWPWPVLRDVYGGGHLLFPGHVAVRLLTMVRAPVSADLNLETALYVKTL